MVSIGKRKSCGNIFMIHKQPLFMLAIALVAAAGAVLPRVMAQTPVGVTRGCDPRSSEYGH